MTKTANTKLSIEPATPSDAEAICQIRDDAWLQTYPNEELGITEENIRLNAQGKDGVFVPRRVAWLKGKLAEMDETWTAYVAKIDGVVRGFVIASTDDNGRKFLNSIYIEPGYQAKGLGSQLMQKALEFLGNDADIYLEVTSYNDNAIRFYERLGFIKTGNPVEEEADRPSYMTSVPQIEMVLPSNQS